MQSVKEMQGKNTKHKRTNRSIIGEDHHLDGVGAFHIESDGLAGQSLDEDLHAGTTAETEHQVQRGLLLDVVVGEGAAVLELLAGEDQTLLIRRDAFLVLDLLLDVLQRQHEQMEKKDTRKTEQQRDKT